MGADRKVVVLAEGLHGINSLAFIKEGRLIAIRLFLGDAFYEIGLSGEPLLSGSLICSRKIFFYPMPDTAFLKISGAKLEQIILSLINTNQEKEESHVSAF